MIKKMPVIRKGRNYTITLNTDSDELLYCPPPSHNTGYRLYLHTTKTGERHFYAYQLGGPEYITPLRKEHVHARVEFDSFLTPAGRKYIQEIPEL